jgi:hypothetical protein
MDSSQVRRGLALFAANYAKRWLEGHLYDRIFETEIGRRVQSMDARFRYGAELGLNLLSVLFDRAMKDDTAFKRLIKEIGLDAAPELSKRIINHARTPEERATAEAFDAMTPGSRLSLLRWLVETPPEKRGEAMKVLRSLSAEEIVELSEMPAEQRRQIIEILTPPDKEKEPDPIVEALDDVAAALRRFRMRIQRPKGGGGEDE